MSSAILPSRRTFVVAAGAAAAAAAWLTPRRIMAATDGSEGPVQVIRREGARTKVRVQTLRGNVSVLTGSGGNIAVLTGSDGKLLVDAGISRANVLPALDDLGAAPIRHLVNTHWHFDHTDGNDWLHAAGATITAHQNTRRRMSAATRVDGWDFTFPPAPAGALPSVCLGGRLTMYLNGEEVKVDLYPPAHTDTDLRVTFSNADVIHVGDTWWNGHYPFIDYSTGGSIDGTIRAAEHNVDAAGRDTLVIPGHGPVGGKKDLQEFRDMLRAVRDGVAKLKKGGRSAEETVAAKPTATFDAKWGGFVISPEAFTKLVYAGV